MQMEQELCTGKNDQRNAVGPKQERSTAHLVLGGLFLTALIACNLIANKFVSVDLGFKTFILSAGVLPYPITFLITDLLSELYGRKKTNQVVGIGFLCSAFVLLILWLGHLFPIPGSPVSSDTYDQVFQNSFRVILSSMIAYLSPNLSISVCTTSGRI